MSADEAPNAGDEAAASAFERPVLGGSSRVRRVPASRTTGGGAASRGATASAVGAPPHPRKSSTKTNECGNFMGG
jgi:hypothetical protein